jgi:hypothetical protein
LKNATSSPYAAVMESTFSVIAFKGSSSERNARSSST